MEVDDSIRDAPIRDADVLIKESKLHAKEIRCELSRYKATKGMRDYEYDDLGTPEEDKTRFKKHLDKKRFRLLELQPGLLNNPQIICEIFEVELDITDGTVVRVLDVDRVSQYADTKTPPHAAPTSNVDVKFSTPSDFRLQEEESDEQATDTGAKSAAMPAGRSSWVSSQNADPGESDRINKIRTLKALEKSRSDERHKRNMNYEALSWRWGNEKNGEYAIMILKGKQHFRKRVSRTLGLALKYLRYRSHPRVIWIDALCINQDDQEERSIQVAMMDRLYTGASQVSIWLGEDEEGDESRVAIGFIKNDVSVLKEFDKLCRDKKYTDQWKALLVLMQREWFSRRWVVQEIALARKATVYYGPDKIGWRQLATAIGLFVEVESATHRLSELMKSDERFNLIPNWFEHISGLPASLLVNESSRVFRDYKREEDEISNDHTSPKNFQDDHDSDPDSWMLEDLSDEDVSDDNAQIAPSDSLPRNGAGPPSEFDDSDSADGNSYQSGVTDKMRRSLLTLEYLVTSLAIFDCGPPHDSLYALVAISRDAFPSPPTALTKRNKEVLLTEVMEKFVERKPFPLDYNMSYPDVCRCFVEFCIRQRATSDQTTALDILCRPWSKDWSPQDKNGYVKGSRPQKPVRILKHEGDWEIFSQKEKETHDQMVRDKRGSEKSAVSDYNYIYKDQRPPRSDKCKDTPEAWKEWKQRVLKHGDGVIPREDVHKKWARWLPHGKLKKGMNSSSFWKQWEKFSGAGTESHQGESKQDRDNSTENAIATLGLPSWVAKISNARFDIFRHPGMDMVKMGRKNADPLVGNLENNAGIYRAAQLTRVDLDNLRFNKREIQPEGLSHYSLYVKGFM